MLSVKPKLDFIAFHGAENEKKTCTVLVIKTNSKTLFQFVSDAVRAQVHCLRIFKDSVVLELWEKRKTDGAKQVGGVQTMQIFL